MKRATGNSERVKFRGNCDADVRGLGASMVRAWTRLVTRSGPEVVASIVQERRIGVGRGVPEIGS